MILSTKVVACRSFSISSWGSCRKSCLMCGSSERSDDASIIRFSEPSLTITVSSPMVSANQSSSVYAFQPKPMAAQGLPSLLMSESKPVICLNTKVCRNCLDCLHSKVCGCSQKWAGLACADTCNMHNNCAAATGSMTFGAHVGVQ